MVMSIAKLTVGKELWVMSYKLKTAALMLLLCSMALPAQAYLGPGGAVSSVGALLALIGAVLLAIVGFVWFPLKRMIKGEEPDTDEDMDED